MDYTSCMRTIKKKKWPGIFSQSMSEKSSSEKERETRERVAWKVDRATKMILENLREHANDPDAQA